MAIDTRAGLARLLPRDRWIVAAIAVLTLLRFGLGAFLPLSFDEAAMEVLEWLDEAPFEWDMYVDLPANCIRYCFRIAADAMAFKRQFATSLQRRAAGGEH